MAHSFGTQEYEELRGTVSSARLDSLERMLTNLSRERAAELTRAGLVDPQLRRGRTDQRGLFARRQRLRARYGKYVVDAVDRLRARALDGRCRKFI